MGKTLGYGNINLGNVIIETVALVSGRAVHSVKTEPNRTFFSVNRNRIKRKITTENRTEMYSVFNRNRINRFGYYRKPKIKTEI